MLAGHSYGGVVITNAATGNPNVKALVYIAAFAPDQGDCVLSLSELGTDDELGPAALDIRPYPNADGTHGQEGYIKLDLFRRIFAGDLDRKLARQMALTQRGASLVALGEPSGPPAWKTIPSYYMIAGEDRTIGTDVEVAMAKRIKPRKTVTVARRQPCRDDLPASQDHRPDRRRREVGQVAKPGNLRLALGLLCAAVMGATIKVR